jgi:hypothetical protein
MNFQAQKKTSGDVFFFGFGGLGGDENMPCRLFLLAKKSIS